MKKMIMFLTGATLCRLCLFGGELLAAEPGSRAELRAAVQERITEANRTFREAVTAFPGAEQVVTISFTQSLSLREAVEKALIRGLQVEGFRHGDATHSGGYTIAPGQSLDEAIADYEVRIPQFIDQHRTDAL